ncbi:MAG: hypothetical protein IMW99_02870 [Firmicutes bacterium]|nr:hypothetical protein [Bacillota bacterium]
MQRPATKMEAADMNLLAKTRHLNRLAQPESQETDYTACASLIREACGPNWGVAILDVAAHILGEAGLTPAGRDLLSRRAQREALSTTMAPFRRIWDGLPVAAYPLRNGSERRGFLVFVGAARADGEPSGEEEFLFEYAASLLTLRLAFLMRRASDDALWQQESVRNALQALSFSELYALRHVLAAIPQGEGLIVASRIADSLQLTRSVIVTALRKLESAGLIHTRSLGMKGTYVRVLNPALNSALEESLPELDNSHIVGYMARRRA